MPAHKHADLMLQYAQDAQETDKPWERWEYDSTGREGHFVWRTCTTLIPMFDLNLEYRRKTAVILINGIEVPEPMRVAPPSEERFYIVDLSKPCMWAESTWRDLPFRWYSLSIGICHLTEEAAIKHAEALLSFTKVQE